MRFNTPNTAEELKKTGVYCIHNTVNEKRYIGSAAKTFIKRWAEHVYKLRRKQHRNRHLQSAWLKDGEMSFEFSIISFCDPSECVVCEQFYIDKFNACDDSFGYNILPTAGSNRGFRHSEDSKRKSSESNKGLKRSAEARLRMSLAHIGKSKGPHSEETKAKMSKAARGRKMSEQQKQKKRTIRLGKQLSPETKAKMSASTRGRIMPEYHREAIRRGLAKKKLSRMKTMCQRMLFD